MIGVLVMTILMRRYRKDSNYGSRNTKNTFETMATLVIMTTLEQQWA